MSRKHGNRPPGLGTPRFAFFLKSQIARSESAFRTFLYSDLGEALVEGAQTVKCKPGTERVAAKGAVERGLRSSLRKAHKP